MGFEPGQCCSHLESVNEFKDRIKEALDEAKAALTKSRDNMARYYDQKHTPAPNYQPRDKVYLDASDIQTTWPSKKLSHRHLGPFKIVKKGAYCLKLPWSMKCLHLVFNIVKLTPVTPALPNPILGHHLRPPPPPETIDGEEEWVVEEILDSKVISWKLWYLVKQKGFGIEHNSWEPWDSIHASDLVAQFYWKHPGAACQVRAIDFSTISFHVVPSCHSLEGGGECQGTLIFSFTFLHYSSKMSTTTSKHLVILSISLPLLSSISIRQTWSVMDFTSDSCFYFYLHLCLFLLSFLSSFSYVIVFHLYFQGLIFPFTYSHRLAPGRSLSFSLRISC